MKQLRQLHHYVGLFLSPMILLFALSGAFQTFRLQEEKGYGGTPPDWIVWMASIHKDQAPPRERHTKAEHAPKAEASVTPKAAKLAAMSKKKPFTLPLKIFVVLVAIGLIISTMLGIAIGLNNRAMRRTSILLLIAGTIVPIALLML
ncbi:hypothetical protein GRI39_10370 [Altererythrobacter indicus]|uniref:PepSY domain-containing protein n=1 Tax=Altericroceibacterium indicum TaxID=374177 RepID=A0A845A7V5_9SPHN|nr:hypothetical protein [Altericroceibacterium indicum]MXP26442.1 hypothetical protein [Altericroceibacterium indicum]